MNNFFRSYASVSRNVTKYWVVFWHNFIRKICSRAPYLKSDPSTLPVQIREACEKGSGMYSPVIMFDIGLRRNVNAHNLIEFRVSLGVSNSTIDEGKQASTNRFKFSTISPSLPLFVDDFFYFVFHIDLNVHLIKCHFLRF